MKGHSKNAIANGSGWLPFWFGGKFNKRLIQKRARRKGKDINVPTTAMAALEEKEK